MEKVIKISLITILIIVVAVHTIIFIAYLHRLNPEDKRIYNTTNSWIFSDTKIGAHRSGARIAPEETLRASKNCIENPEFKVDVFEFDLHLTKDEQIVLLYDSSLNRTSDSKTVFGEQGVKVNDKTYDELRQLNMVAKSENENGYYRFIIEIKDSGELGMKIADILYETAKDNNILNKIAVGTSKPEVLSYIQKEHPDITTMGATEKVINFYKASLLNSDNLNPSYQMLTTRTKTTCPLYTRLLTSKKTWIT